MPLSISLDEDWVGALSRLGRLVLSLHRLAATASAGDFQRLAFEALSAELPFDSGIWATGAFIYTLLLKAAVPIELGTLRETTGKKAAEVAS